MLVIKKKSCLGLHVTLSSRKSNANAINNKNTITHTHKKKQMQEDDTLLFPLLLKQEE